MDGEDVVCADAEREAFADGEVAELAVFVDADADDALPFRVVEVSLGLANDQENPVVGCVDVAGVREPFESVEAPAGHRDPDGFWAVVEGELQHHCAGEFFGEGPAHADVSEGLELHCNGHVRYRSG